ncbi:MAG: NAD(P)H-dependent oxidoreductase subunit E [Chloroflexi bacterium]|nr:NAD(P)H-dependent oxidoreductase subunit E [Chloroflexota bacterium]
MQEQTIEERGAGILISSNGEPGAIIPVLQKTQVSFGYLTQDAFSQAATSCRVCQRDVFGVASFCAHFHFHRPEDHDTKLRPVQVEGQSEPYLGHTCTPSCSLHK